MSLLILNINGTVKVAEEGEFTNTPPNQQIITGALLAIGKYAALKWTIVGVSNQGGVKARNPETKKPWKTLEDCVKEQRITLSYLKPMTVIYIASDLVGKECYRVARTRTSLEVAYGDYRLPGVGMLRLAINRYATKKNEEILYVDDQETGEDAAMDLGIPFKYAFDWWNEGEDFKLRQEYDRENKTRKNRR